MIFIGHLLNTGRLDFYRVIAFAGSEVKKPAYCKMTIGQQLSTLIEGNVTTGKSLRVINGNVMTGVKTSARRLLGCPCDGSERDSRRRRCARDFRLDHAAFQRLLFQPCLHELVDGQEGVCARRSCERRRTPRMIMSGEYDRVFPMDIFPEQLVKAVSPAT